MAGTIICPVIVVSFSELKIESTLLEIDEIFIKNHLKYNLGN